MLTWQYILSQVFVVLAMIFMGVTFLIKNKSKILFFSSLSVLCFALEFLFLGSFTGLIVNLVSVFRGIWFFINEKKSKSNDWVSLIAISLLLIIAGCFAAKIWLDYFAIVATILYTYSIWQKNIKVYRYLAVIGSVFWIAYNIVYLSILGLICEVALLVFETVGIFLLYRKGERRFKSSREENLDSKML